MINNSTPSRLLLIGGTIISAVCWYFAIDLSGSFGWLLWFAPIPLLIIAFQGNKKQAFFAAFIAYLIGRLNWLPFFFVLMPSVMAIFITILLPLIFSLLILLTRWLVLKTKSSFSVFVYPVVAAAAEFTLSTGSIDGTAGSLAYTQSNYLPIIQIASITGIWGIIFLVALIPSTLAVAWFLKEDKKQSKLALAFGCIILFVGLTFGWVRLNSHSDSKTIPVGLTVISEDLHQIAKKTPVLTVAQNYIDQIAPLAKAGAAYVIFPEKALLVKATGKDSVIQLLQKGAAENNVTIIGGLLIFKEKSKQNIVVFVSPDGKVQEYVKRFHVKGWEDGEEVGDKVGWLQNTPVPSAMAICKDMDFPQWLRQYSEADLLFAPAWDFERDGWLHSRMAVLRGVENGFTIVRAARQGRLTVTDYCGRVIGEEINDHGNKGSLLIQAPVYSIDTLYSKWSDWFGLTSLVIVLALVAISFFRKQA